MEPLSIDLEEDLPAGWSNFTFPESGTVVMPIVYAEWLDQHDLIEEFDRWWISRIEKAQHGDALTPFANAHDAPGEVVAAIET